MGSVGRGRKREREREQHLTHSGRQIFSVRWRFFPQSMESAPKTVPRVAHFADHTVCVCVSWLHVCVCVCVCVLCLCHKNKWLFYIPWREGPGRPPTPPPPLCWRYFHRALSTTELINNSLFIALEEGTQFSTSPGSPHPAHQDDRAAVHGHCSIFGFSLVFRQRSSNGEWSGFVADAVESIRFRAR